MKKQTIFALLVVLLFSHSLPAQLLSVKKGIVVDSVPVSDSNSESFALYLPTTFESSVTWPILFVFDMEGKASQALAMFREAAEENGYILAASNNLKDSLSIADNIIITSRMMKSVSTLFPLQKQRMFTVGRGGGSPMAALVPSFIKEIAGVVTFGSGIPNTDILNERNPFYFLGIVGLGDFKYTEMRKDKELLTKKKIPNHLFTYEGGEEWPNLEFRAMAIELLTFYSVGQGHIGGNKEMILQSYGRMMQMAERQLQARRPYRAYLYLEEIYSVFKSQLELDSLQVKLRNLKKDKLYRAQKRNENSIFLKEALIRDDFLYYLEEDVLTYNFNNLGWWNYQMGELSKYSKSIKVDEKYMGQRLEGYLNALIEDHIDHLLQAEATDEEALLFLWMLKTIAAPREYSSYLKIISMSSKYEDYGTALFYLEELLKNGYDNKTELYKLEHTALLRITPEYNAIISEYLKDARYDINQE